MIKLDKEQQEAVKRRGFSITELPSLRPTARITLYKWDERMQAVIPCPNLPADPASLQRYLSRGFTIRPEDLKPQTNGFTCEVCGKQVKTKLALSGHKRTHNKQEVKE